MEKKTIFALIAVLVLGGAAFWLWKQSESKDKPKEKVQPLATISASKIATLEITQPGGKEKVTLARSGDKWQVTTPYQKPAEQNLVNEATKALEKIKWGDVTSENKSMFSELDISDDKAIHVIAKDNSGTVLADLYLGKSMGTDTMVKIGNQDQVYRVTDLPVSSFKKETKIWRDHTIFAFKAEEAQKIIISKAGSIVALERIPESQTEKERKPGMMASSIYDAKWKVVDSSDAELKNQKSESLDNRLLNSMVQSIAALRADDFQDSPSSDKSGLLGDEKFSIEVTFGGGKIAKLHLGAQVGDSYLVQNAENPQVFTLQKYKAESLLHSPKDIQDKTLVALKADDLEQVIIETSNQTSDLNTKETGQKSEPVKPKMEKVIIKKDEKAWTVEGIEKPDENRIKSFFGIFEHFSGERFVEPGDKALASLANPITVITLKYKNGPEVSLKIGEPQPEKTNANVVDKKIISNPDKVVIQRNQQEPLWISKYQADNLRKKPADFQKIDRPAPGAMGPGGPRFIPGSMPMPQ